MQTKATTTRGNAATKATSEGQKASNRTQTTRRAILLASLLAMGFPAPADIANGTLIACHNAARRVERCENPYLESGFEYSARVIVFEGHGVCRIGVDDEQRRYRDAAELEQIAIEIAIESQPQKLPDPPAVIVVPVPEKDGDPSTSLRMTAEGQTAVPRRGAAFYLAEIESLEMPK